MNTVEALNVLGKALCGDSFEVKPGLTDAETILEIAKNYEGGGSGSGGGRVIEMPMDGWGSGVEIVYESGLAPSDFVNAKLVASAGENSLCEAIVTAYRAEDDVVMLISIPANPQASQLNPLMGHFFTYTPSTGDLVENSGS